MQVRITRDERVYIPFSCEVASFHAGQVVVGDMASFLASTNPSLVEHVDGDVVVAPPAGPVEPPLKAPEPNPADVVAAPAGGAPTGPVEATPEPEPDVPETDFDPAAHTASEVMAYVRKHPETRAAIRARENSPGGKRRTVLLAQLG